MTRTVKIDKMSFFEEPAPAKSDSMAKFTEDLSFDLTDMDAPAVFLPSLSANYVAYSSLYESRITEDRKAQGLSNDGSELNFLREDSGSFYWPYALYSAGYADLRIEKNADGLSKKESMIRSRDRSKTLIVGDSGGYQIGKGILQFDWNDFEGEKNNELRMQILRWLEATADISMTLDVPTWGINEPRCGLTSFDDCLKKTLINHDFFIKNRVPGATKFLNILHGRNKEETNIWWEAVKDLPFEGWAFAGINMLDYERILRRLIIMRDGGYLNKERSWIHFLGISRMPSGCAFSALQRVLRSKVDPSITISYDASSPFFSTAKGRIYTKHSFSSKGMSFTLDKCFDNKDLAKSKLSFPFGSPIGRKLTVGDICYKGHDIESKSSWDTYSYMYLMNHNCYMHVKGMSEANKLYALPRKEILHWFPSALLDFKDLVEEVFTSQTPFDVIEANHKLLNNLSGLKMDDKKLNITETTGLFSFEEDSSDLLHESDEYLAEHSFDDSIIEDLD